MSVDRVQQALDSLRAALAQAQDPQTVALVGIGLAVVAVAEALGKFEAVAVDTDSKWADQAPAQGWGGVVGRDS